MLDSLEVEKMRGIAVKSSTLTLACRHPQRGSCLLNLIATPGHVDFGYEVSRSLKECQGAVLLVDALQGIQAQTASNFYQAFCQNLTIVPGANEVDLVSSQHIVSDVKSQMRKMLDDAWCDDDILEVSAKTGFGCDTLLERILDTIPPPKSDEPHLTFKGLLFDMFFHPIKGAVLLCTAKDGELRRRQKIAFGHASDVLTVSEAGILAPGMMPTDCLRAGQVGYVGANVKNIRQFRVGDTIFAKNCAKLSKPFDGRLKVSSSPKPNVCRNAVSS